MKGCLLSQQLKLPFLVEFAFIKVWDVICTTCLCACVQRENSFQRVATLFQGQSLHICKSMVTFPEDEGFISSLHSEKGRNSTK